VDRTGLCSCLMAGFGICYIEISGSTIRE